MRTPLQVALVLLDQWVFYWVVIWHYVNNHNEHSPTVKNPTRQLSDNYIKPTTNPNFFIFLPWCKMCSWKSLNTSMKTFKMFNVIIIQTENYYRISSLLQFSDIDFFLKYLFSCRMESIRISSLRIVLPLYISPPRTGTSSAPSTSSSTMPTSTWCPRCSNSSIISCLIM